MTQGNESRLDRVEGLLDGLAQMQQQSQARVDELAQMQQQSQARIDQMSSRVDEFVFQAQRLFTQQGTRLGVVEGRAERLEAIITSLNRNYEAQQSQLQEFKVTTNAALERIDRILDYLLRGQSRGEN